MECLCQYTSLENAKLILENMTLKLGTIAGSNDPLEKRLISVNYNDNESNFYEGHVQKAWNNILKLFCFTQGQFSADYDEEKDVLLRGLDVPYYKPHMWYSYGRNNKGVCLIFDRNKLNEEIHKQFDSLYDIVGNEIKYESYEDMTYSCSVEGNEPFEYQIGSEKVDKQIYEYLKNYDKRLFFLKDEDWKKENEYRYLCIRKPGTRNNQEFLDISKCLVGVIFGCDVQTSYDEKLLKKEEEDLDTVVIDPVTRKRKTSTKEEKENLIKRHEEIRANYYLYKNVLSILKEKTNLVSKVKDKYFNVLEKELDVEQFANEMEKAENLQELFIAKIFVNYMYRYLDEIDPESNFPFCKPQFEEFDDNRYYSNVLDGLGSTYNPDDIVFTAYSSSDGDDFY